MPSPVAHGSAAFLVRAFTARHDRLRRAVSHQPLFFYAATVATLWTADLDFVLRVFSDHPGFQHGGATHSLCAGVLFGVVFAIACRLRYGAVLPLAPVLAIGIGCAWTHTLMDMATWRGGVMLLWPLSDQEYATIPLFFGARHSQLTAWRLHLVTLATELLFVLPLWWLTKRSWRRDVVSRVEPGSRSSERQRR